VKTGKMHMKTKISSGCLGMYGVKKKNMRMDTEIFQINSGCCSPTPHIQI
jgi:hypothetical protein